MSSYPIHHKFPTTSLQWGPSETSILCHWFCHNVSLSYFTTDSLTSFHGGYPQIFLLSVPASFPAWFCFRAYGLVGLVSALRDFSTSLGLVLSHLERLNSMPSLRAGLPPTPGKKCPPFLISIIPPVLIFIHLNMQHYLQIYNNNLSINFLLFNIFPSISTNEDYFTLLQSSFPFVMLLTKNLFRLYFLTEQVRTAPLTRACLSKSTSPNSLL